MKRGWVALAMLPIGLFVIGSFVWKSRSSRAVYVDNSTSVVVANQNIPPGTELDPLIDAGAFRVVEVPNEPLVPSAIWSIDELRGQATAALIYQNEQIPIERLEGIL